MTTESSPKIELEVTYRTGVTIKMQFNPVSMKDLDKAPEEIVNGIYKFMESSNPTDRMKLDNHVFSLHDIVHVTARIV